MRFMEETIFPAGDFLHDGEIIRLKSRVRACEQVAGPDSDALPIQRIVTMDPAVKF